MKNELAVVDNMKFIDTALTDKRPNRTIGTSIQRSWLELAVLALVSWKFIFLIKHNELILLSLIHRTSLLNKIIVIIIFCIKIHLRKQTNWICRSLCFHRNQLSSKARRHSSPGESQSVAVQHKVSPVLVPHVGPNHGDTKCGGVYIIRELYSVESERRSGKCVAPGSSPCH